MAVTRWRLGTPRRCPVCGSYQLTLDYVHGEWMTSCVTCGWERPTDPPPRADADEERVLEAADATAEPCVEMEDFGIYMSPQQARAMAEEASARMAADEATWANAFAVASEHGRLEDAHRLTFTAARHKPAPGTELVYDCGNDGCVNPAHAREGRLPHAEDWSVGIVEQVIVTHPAYLELTVTTSSSDLKRVFVDRGALDRYGLGDASSLLDRVVCLSQPDGRGWLRLVPIARRSDYGHDSVSSGWLHPIGSVAGGDPCPCGSETAYAHCHGTRTAQD